MEIGNHQQLSFDSSEEIGDGAPTNCVILNTFLRTLRKRKQREEILNAGKEAWPKDDNDDNANYYSPSSKCPRSLLSHTRQVSSLPSTSIVTTFPCLKTTARRSHVVLYHPTPSPLKDTPCLEGLPSEMLLSILSYLNIPDLLRLASLNSYFYQTLNSSLAENWLWKVHVQAREHEIATRFHWVVKRYTECGRDWDDQWYDYLQLWGQSNYSKEEEDQYKEKDKEKEVEVAGISSFSYRERCMMLWQLACEQCFQLTRNVYNGRRLCEFCRLTGERKAAQRRLVAKRGRSSSFNVHLIKGHSDLCSYKLFMNAHPK